MPPLVDPSWLSARLYQPDTVVLDATLPPVGVTPVVDTRARYLAQHIPGALFCDIEELSDGTSTLPHMLPSADLFAQSMSALGVSDDSTVVVYEQEGPFSAPRAWWMLRTFGARSVYVLDGGLRAWLASGLPTETGPVNRPPAIFHAHLAKHAVTDLVQLQQGIATGAQILDARSAARFNGTAPEPRPGLPSGHMPGARNLPFTELAEGTRFKAAAQLAELFAGKGLDLQQPITTTCGSGVTAAVLALGLEMCGAGDVSLYDGSWAEYAQHPDAVILKS